MSTLRNDSFHNCGWEGCVEAGAECAGLGVSCATSLSPILGFQQLGREAPASRKHHLCSVLLLPPGSHGYEEEDGEGSQQFWAGKGWQISPQVLPDFHARICPALALPMGVLAPPG